MIPSLVTRRGLSDQVLPAGLHFVNLREFRDDVREEAASLFGLDRQGGEKLPNPLEETGSPLWTERNHCMAAEIQPEVPV